MQPRLRTPGLDRDPSLKRLNQSGAGGDVKRGTHKSRTKQRGTQEVQPEGLQGGRGEPG